MKNYIVFEIEGILQEFIIGSYSTKIKAIDGIIRYVKNLPKSHKDHITSLNFRIIEANVDSEEDWHIENVYVRMPKSDKKIEQEIKRGFNVSST